MSAGSVLALAVLLPLGVACTTAGVQAPTAAAPGTPAEGWVRLGHFAAGRGPVDVLVDGVAQASGVTAGTVTPYVRVPAGTHQVSAVPAGTPGAAPLVSVATGVPANGSETVGVVSTRDGIGVQVYDDSRDRPPPGQALVRFIHTVPDIPAVDIAVVGGPVLAANVAYPGATAYAAVAPGTYDLEVRRAGGSEVLLRVAAWTIAAGSEATVVVNRNDGGALSVVPLIDAGGTVAMPVGGASTGMGGMARSVTGTLDPRTGGLDDGWVIGLVLAAAACACLVLRSRVIPVVHAIRHSRSATVVLAASFLTLGLGACGSARSGDATAAGATTPATASPSDGGSTDVTPEPGAAPAGATSVPVASGANVNATTVGDPVAVSIPSLGVTSSLVGLGLAADGTVQVPASVDQAGWFTGGPKPGQIGAAVILGHVDSHTGPGVFYRLGELAAGAAVIVRTTTGDVRFVTQRIEQVPKDRFPSDAVYSSGPEPDLRLVTCGGNFDRSSGHYEDNVVAFLTPEAPS